MRKSCLTLEEKKSGHDEKKTDEGNKPQIWELPSLLWFYLRLHILIIQSLVRLSRNTVPPLLQMLDLYAIGYIIAL